MTDEQARKLAQRFIDTWPSGPKAYIWRDTFKDHDPDIAADAYRKVVANTEKGAPTPGNYLAAYHSIRRSVDDYSQPRYAPGIPHSEYLARLQARAAKGDANAADELENWRTFLGEPA